MICVVWLDCYYICIYMQPISDWVKQVGHWGYGTIQIGETSVRTTSSTNSSSLIHQWTMFSKRLYLDKIFTPPTTAAVHFPSTSYFYKTKSRMNYFFPPCLRSQKVVARVFQKRWKFLNGDDCLICFENIEKEWLFASFFVLRNPHGTKLMHYLKEIDWEYLLSLFGVEPYLLFCYKI